MSRRLEPPPSRSASGRSRRAPEDGLKRRVLLVDCDECALEVLAAALCSEFVVTCARDGHEALCAGPGGFDVIVTELELPLIDGESFKDELDELRIRAPVIFLSIAWDLPVRAQTRKAFGHLAKPFVPEELTAMIRRAVQRVSAREEVTAVGPPPERPVQALRR